MQYELQTEKFRNDLSPGETIQWTGQPNERVIFHFQDSYLIPFSLLWGGFAIFWEMGALGFWRTPHRGGGNAVSLFMSLWGVPFVLFGQYFIWGRFVYDWWRKKKTFYAVTNKRVLILEEVRNRKLTSIQLAENAPLDKTTRLDGIGTLAFGVPQPKWNRSSWGDFNSDGRPSLRDIDEVDRIYRLISDMRDRLTKEDRE